MDVRDDRDETALFALVRYIDDGKECVQLLFAAGADPNARNKDGKTPLGVVDPRNTLVTKLLKGLGLKE